MVRGDSEGWRGKGRCWGEGKDDDRDEGKRVRQ